MMRSLFAGVSGLRNHQVKMDVIGNNIANVNTVAFKSSRITFEESLTQLIKDAQRPHGGVGGTNPQQVGLGSAVGSIDTNFTQGNLETTGNTTDLAIQGDAFFILSDGIAEYYARAGNFSLDGDGRLVSSKNGYIVQGRMADSTGNIASGTPTGNVMLPFGQKAPAKATTSIDFVCNLNSDTQALDQIWSGDFANHAMLTGSAAPGTYVIDATNNTLTIEVDDDMGSTVTRTITMRSQDWGSISNLVGEINYQISEDTNLAGEVVAEVVSPGGVNVVRIRTVDRGGTSTKVKVYGSGSLNLNLTSNTITGTAAPNLTITSGVNDTLTIMVDDGAGNYTTDTLTITAGVYASVALLGTEIQTQITASGLSGEVRASGATGVIVLDVDPAGSGTHLLAEGNACEDMNLPSNFKTGTAASTLFNDLSVVGNPLTNGDIIKIAGTNQDGTVVNSDYVYATNDTVQDFIDGLNSAFSGSTASLSTDGNILLTDSIRGDTNTTITLTFLDNDGSGSVITLPSFVSTQRGRDAGTHTASITVYDSGGATHTVSLTFTNISTADSPNMWSWEATVDNGEIIPSAGNKGNIRFNADGSLAVFNSIDGQMLTFDPGGGAETVTIALGAGESGTFSGITQLMSATTTVAKSQDGYGMGNLQTISIADTGEITGHFSNGVSQNLAQIVLAKFNNPSGLSRTGDNMYQASANSGTPVKGTVGGGITSTIASGALEMSNVDLAQEFTDMIVAQRGFQANARVITTSDTLLDEIVRLKR